MGPLLLSRLLELNEVQEGVLNIAFRVAADEKMPLVDLADLRALVGNIANARERARPPSTATSRRLPLARSSGGFWCLRNRAPSDFFGEPALDIKDFLRVAPDGRGVVNVFSADKLMETPRVYATFLLWLLTKLWQTLPEVGDQPKPKLVFFFDEAHLLFNDAPKPLMERIEQIARLVRSKGVGVYFITQNPVDVPKTVASQLNNRIQHKLNAYTPQDQAGIEAAAKTFRQNPALKVDQVIKELKVGEALVSVLENKGEPSIVQRTLIRPPQGRLGPVSAEERRGVIEYSPYFGKYEEKLDRESAHEMLGKKAAAEQADAGGAGDWLGGVLGGGRAQAGKRGSAGHGRHDRQGAAAVARAHRRDDDQKHHRRLDQRRAAVALVTGQHSPSFLEGSACRTGRLRPGSHACGPI